MRAFLILLICAVTLGLAGGYGWSLMNAPSAKATKAKATMIAIPPSPGERPETVDQEWGDRPSEKGALAIETDRPDPTAVEQSVHYSGCNEVRAAGKAPLHAGEPGYSI